MVGATRGWGGGRVVPGAKLGAHRGGGRIGTVRAQAVRGPEGRGRRVTAVDAGDGRRPRRSGEQPGHQGQGGGRAGTGAADRRLRLRYDGADAALPIAPGELATVKAAFEAAHQRLFGFVEPERTVLIASVEVEATELSTAHSGEGRDPGSFTNSPGPSEPSPKPPGPGLRGWLSMLCWNTVGVQCGVACADGGGGAL